MAANSLLWVLLSVGLMWAKSSYSKFTSGNFVSGLGETLSKVSPKNPYPFYKQFIYSVAIPNSSIFGFMVLWGELLVSVSIVVGTVLLMMNPLNKMAALALVAGLLGGLLLNITFWLGFGWTSASTDSINLLMGVIELIGIFVLFRQFVQA